MDMPFIVGLADAVLSAITTLINSVDVYLTSAGLHTESLLLCLGWALLAAIVATIPLRSR